MLHTLRTNKWATCATLLAVTLAAGWAVREKALADDKVRLLESKTVNLAELKLTDHVYEGKPRGEAALYFNGPTDGCRNLTVGVFRLRPKTEPHPVHTHVDEELLIVASGTGEISCDGKTTKVGPGSVMYTRPNAPHNIKNTGDDVMTFYFVKWIGHAGGGK